MTNPDNPSIRSSYPELFEQPDSWELETFVERLEQYCTSNQPSESLNQIHFKNFGTDTRSKLNRNPMKSVLKSYLSISNWRQRLVISVISALLVIGIALVIPQTREVMAGWFGFTIEQRTNSGFVIKANRAEWATSPDANFTYNLVGIRQDRWNFTEKWPAATPIAGKRTLLPNGKMLSVPAYLPEGYRWQTAALPQTNLTIVEPHFWSTSSSGGGGGLIPVEYDQDMVMYLIGGNKENDLLVVSQYDMNIDSGLIVYPFFVGIPEPQSTHSALPKPTASGNSAATTAPINRISMPGPEIELGLLVQAVSGQKGIKLELGSVDLHETKVKSLPAWWYEGTWDSEGTWVTSDGWINLIWEQNGILFQITGQHLDTTELLKIAQSLPEK